MERRDTLDDILIRGLEAGDCNDIAQFEREISLASFGDEAVDDIDFYRRRVRKILDAKNDFTVIAVRDGVLLGWAWLGPRTNFVTQEMYADFKSFYIAPPARGTNCAFRLMGECLRHCREKKYTRIVGRTHSTNAAMSSLYALYRFAPTTVTYELRFDKA
jgi:GNAT superfamily N-acetyltransferase